jgi:hypothetical protein
LTEGSPTGALQSDSATSSKAESSSDFDHTNSDSDRGERRIIKRDRHKVKHSQNPNLQVGLRRSKRNAPTNSQMGYLGNGTPEAKKRLRQRLVVNTEYVSDSGADADLRNYQEARFSDSESG